MKKTKFYIVLLFTLVCIFSFVIVGCNGCNNCNGNQSEDFSDGDKTESNQETYINPEWALSGKSTDFYIVNDDGTLIEGLESDDIEVEFGTNVFLTLPVVIDGKANVVDVSFAVKDNSGNIVELTDGAFFAMDGTGYTVEYTVVCVDGEEMTFANKISVIGADKMYVGVDYIISLDELSYVKDVKFVNVSESIYDLENLLNNAQKQEFAKAKSKDGVSVVWTASSKSTGSINLGSSTLDFSKYPKANYVVYATAKSDAGSNILFAENVDFIDDSGFAFSEWDNLQHEVDCSMLISSVADTTVEVVEDNLKVPVLENKSGQFYKIVTTNSAKAFSFNFNALHSADYYKNYSALGISFSFDLYLTATNADGDAPVLGVFGTCNGNLNGEIFENRTQYNANKWHTVSMSLDTALNGNICGFESLYYISGGTTSAGECTFYIGNLSMSQDLSQLTDSSVKLVDIKDKTTYDAKIFFTADELETITNTNAKFVLAAYNANRKYSLNGSTVSFSDIPCGAYTVTAVSGGVSVYGKNVDFYNSSEAPVYNDRISTDYINGYRIFDQNPSTNLPTRALIAEIITTVDNPENHNGKYYHFGATDKSGSIWGTPLGFNVMAVHSKAYYELYKDYTFTFDYYMSFSNKVCEGFDSEEIDKTPGWYTVSIPVETLLDKWDYIHGDSEVKNSGFESCMFTVRISWGNRPGYDVYFGNFKITK